MMEEGEADGALQFTVGDQVIMFLLETGAPITPWQMRWLSAVYAASDTEGES